MKIVVLDATPLDAGDIDWQPLAALGEVIRHDRTDRQELAARCAGADIVLTNKTEIQAEDVPALKGCRLVGVLATGANVLDLDTLAKAGIEVVNVPAYGIEDVAQHALALLLELARHTVLHSDSVKAGEWAKKGWCYWLKPPLCLAGLTLGIAGFGSIGQMMGRYGACLGMKVLAWSRSRNARADYPFTYAGLPELLASSDVISLHCPLTPQTDKMINAASIASMKTGAIIINTARGGLVDEAAAAAALVSGKLGGLGTDVLASEPARADNPLLTAPNTLITPHMAWATLRARQNIVDIMAANISAFLAGKPQNLINQPLHKK